MKTYNFFVGAGLLLVLASCETSRQATDTSTSNAGSTTSAASTATTATDRNSSTTMNSTSPTAASASDPMLNTPAAAASASTSPVSSTPASSSTTPNSANSNTVNPAANSQVNSNTATASNSPTSVSATMNQNTNVADTTPKASWKGTMVTAPQNIETSFKTQFPNATNVQWYRYNRADVPIDWELTGWPTLTERDYAVMYNVDNTPYYGWYDANGNWVGSTSRLTNHANLPAPVSQLISTKYPGYTISEVHAETYKDRSGYEIEMAKGTDKIKMVVDANGNILKQKSKTAATDGKVIKEKTKN